MSSSCIDGSYPDSGASRETGAPGSGGASGTIRKGHLTLAVWALVVFTAFLFGATIVSVVMTRQAHEAARTQMETLKALNESMREVQRSLAELTQAIREAQEQPREEEEENSYRSPSLGDGRV